MSKKSFPRKVGEWTQLNEQEIYDNAWIKVTHSEVLNPNGGQGVYGVVHFKNLALGVIPLDKDLNTWLVGQERFPFDGKYTWEIIEGGGPIELNPLKSAQRELAEEASLQAKNWELIQEMDLSNSATNERALIYLATNLSSATAKADATEKLEIKKIPFINVFEMVLKGEIIDSLSVVGILKAHHLLKEKGLL